MDVTAEENTLRRFLYPLGMEPKLWDGFLPDPEGEFGRYTNPGLTPAEEMHSSPCTVVLGELGIGKSTLMRQQAALVGSRGTLVLERNLGDYHSEPRLQSAIFQDATVMNWQAGDGTLYAFLDSLDEGSLSVTVKADLLRQELATLPCERLRLFLACRSSSWSSKLGAALQEQFGCDSVSVQCLAPLRRNDVEAAVRLRGGDPSNFLSQVYEREVVHLAAVPLTMKWLVDLYLAQGSLPRSRGELVREACRRLCEETAEGRRERARLEPAERLAVASRIAAVTALAGKAGIRLGPHKGPVKDAADDAFLHADGLYGLEIASQMRIKVGEAELKEAVGSGLFAPRGNRCFGWAHNDYRDCLAAAYLHERATADQIMSLLLHPSDPHYKLVPQLQGIAAWMVNLDPRNFITPVLRSDPEVLLRCDETVMDDSTRAILVDAVLKLFGDNPHTDRSLPLYKLDHPRIAEQIRVVALDRNANQWIRHIAIRIAEACKTRELGEDLLAIALDEQDLTRIRTDAISAIARICDKDTRGRLLPIASGEGGDDPDDEVKGCALQGLWPECLDALSLFELLTHPKNIRLFGSYQAFCSYYLMQHLRPPDLPVALRWIARQPRSDIAHTFHRLAQAIVDAAWENLDVPDVVNALAEAIASRTVEHDFSALEIKAPSDESRLALLDALLRIAPGRGVDAHNLLAFGTPRVVSNADLSWLLSRLRSDDPEDMQHFICELVYFIADVYHSPADLEAVLRNENQVLRARFAHLLDPVELGSARAQRLQEAHAEEREWQTKQQQKKPLLKPPPQERVAFYLNLCQEGNLNAWAHLNREMTLQPDSTHYGDGVNPDITSLPGWLAADADTRTRIVAVSEKYVTEQDPQTHKWLAKDLVVNYPIAYAGYKALMLLMTHRPERLHAMSPDLWSRWAPTVVAANDLSFAKGSAGETLVSVAHAKAPDSTAEALLRIVDKYNDDHGFIPCTEMLERFWDDQIEEGLLRRAHRKNLKPAVLRELLGLLLKHKSARARRYTDRLVGLRRSMEETMRDRSVAAGQALLEYAEDSGWEIVWPAIESDDIFGRAVVEHAIDSWECRNDAGEKRLSDDRLADIFIWAEKRHPHHEDPVIDGFVGTRGRIGMWKNGALAALKSRGAAEALTRIEKAFPGLEWLQYTRKDAEVAKRLLSWRPPAPCDVLEMLEYKDNRIVRNGRELAAVICGSLERFGRALHDETPMVQFLWDKQKDGKWRPKDEAALSDLVKLFLQWDLRDRGLMVRREVEIRRAPAVVQGQETDIYVAVRSNHHDRDSELTAVVEVKGSWNKDVISAIDTQLAGRYMRDSSFDAGVYVVGWFRCQHDDRGPRKSIADIRALLHERATSLSQGGRLVVSHVLDASLGH